MFNKSYITDCEGPLTINDNAYELANHFIQDGGELFSILSLYDDYLVDVEKRQGYKAGNTLKLIIPFMLEAEVSNEDMVDFSKNNISTISESKILLDYVKESMNTYIVSTSYGQYIEALSKYMDFPFENTFYTNVNLCELSLNQEEKEKIKEFREIILKNHNDYKLFDEIFFTEIPKMGFYKILKEVVVVGGEGKKLAIDSLITEKNIDKNEILYIGDSITDVEPLMFAKNNNGVSISFNGNEYSLKAAEIAIVSPSAVASIVIADIFCRYSKEDVVEFIKQYNESGDIASLFVKYDVPDKIAIKFNEIFENNDYPLIKIINEQNFREILDKSKQMRNFVRGQDIGSLG